MAKYGQQGSSSNLTAIMSSFSGLRETNMFISALPALHLQYGVMRITEIMYVKHFTITCKYYKMIKYIKIINTELSKDSEPNPKACLQISLPKQVPIGAVLEPRKCWFSAAWQSAWTAEWQKAEGMGRRSSREGRKVVFCPLKLVQNHVAPLQDMPLMQGKEVDFPFP